MNWHIVVALLLGIIIGLFTMAIMNAGSKADDQMLGDRQYEEN